MRPVHWSRASVAGIALVVALGTGCIGIGILRGGAAESDTGSAGADGGGLGADGSVPGGEDATPSQLELGGALMADAKGAKADVKVALKPDLKVSPKADSKVSPKPDSKPPSPDAKPLSPDSKPPAQADSGPTCQSTCASGQTGCSSDKTTALKCAKGTDGCYHFVTAKTCSASQLCQNGACTCNNPCTLGATKCVTGGEATCVADAAGCASFGPAKACIADLVCYAPLNKCMPNTASSCFSTNECLYVGQKVCTTYNHYRLCIKAFNGCLELDCST